MPKTYSVAKVAKFADKLREKHAKEIADKDAIIAELEKQLEDEDILNDEENEDDTLKAEDEDLYNVFFREDK